MSGLEDVKRLREETQAGMLDCKKALTESGGDYEKAKDLLRKKGLAAMAKRADRVASEGVIAAVIAGRAGALAEVKCETDFVSRTPEYQALGKKVADAVLNSADDATIEALILEVGAKCGEKVERGRSVRYELPAGGSGVLASYVHAGGKVGVLIELHCGKADGAAGEGLARLGKTLAMQVAVAKPQYLRREEVPADVLAREKAIFTDQSAADPKNKNKPPAILEKILAGRVEKFYGEVCLLDQEFLIAPESDAKKVSDFIAQSAQKLGDQVTVARYARMALGE